MRYFLETIYVFVLGFVVVLFAIGFAAVYSKATAAEIVTASTYGDARDVRRTGETRVATGARLNKDKMAVAHRTLPFGTWLTLKRGRHIAVVVVNDRGPFIRGRDLDLTYAANHALMCGGLCRVRIEPWQVPLPRSKPDDVIAWGEENGP